MTPPKAVSRSVSANFPFRVNSGSNQRVAGCSGALHQIRLGCNEKTQNCFRSFQVSAFTIPEAWWDLRACALTPDPGAVQGLDQNA